MRVLVLTPFYPSEAAPYAGVFVHRQLLALAELGIRPEVLRTTGWVPPGVGLLSHRWDTVAAIPDAYSWEGIPVSVLRVPSLPRNGLLWAAPWFIRRGLKLKLRETRYDLIHAHFAYPNGYAVATLPERPGLVLTVHGSDLLRYPNMATHYRSCVSHTLGASQQVVACSDALLKKALELNPDARVNRLYIGVDRRIFSQQSWLGPIPEGWPVPHGVPTILYIGNLLRSKGVVDLVEAFALLRSAGFSNAHLVMVGTGPACEDLKAKANSQGLQGRIHFCGAIPNNLIPQWLRCSDVLALPSHSEGLGMVLVEAQAVGVPVVGTAVGGIPEVIQNGVTGLLVPAQDPPALCRALQRVLTDEEFRLGVVENARQNVQARFDLSVNAKELLEHYRSVTYGS